MKALVGAFNQEKALVGAFSVITNLRMQLFEALVGIRHFAASLSSHLAVSGLISRARVTAVMFPVMGGL